VGLVGLVGLFGLRSGGRRSGGVGGH